MKQFKIIEKDARNVIILLYDSNLKSYAIKKYLKYPIGALVMDSATGDLDSWVDQIGHSVASGSAPLRHFFGDVLPGAKPRRWAPPLVTRFGVIPRA